MVYVKNHVVGKWLLENEKAEKVCDDILQIMCSALEQVVHTARVNGVDENEAVRLASQLFRRTEREFDFTEAECDGFCETCKRRDSARSAREKRVKQKQEKAVQKVIKDDEKESAVIPSACFRESGKSAM